MQTTNQAVIVGAVYLILQAVTATNRALRLNPIWIINQITRNYFANKKNVNVRGRRVGG